MPLKLKLKPREKVLIAGAMIINGDTPAQIFIENKVPLLRQKDILVESEAKSVCSQIYFVIQLMYFAPDNLRDLHKLYWKHVRKLLAASPSAINLISQISEFILVEKYYDALKLTKKLIQYEKELIENAKKSAESLRESEKADHLRAGN
ncbi:MAG: flagellar biosynthesis repressor FlbT [Opitutales bacterium]|nr:flagellar biosynthesis repressor FlbT [Opitutales bacterium]